MLVNLKKMRKMRNLTQKQLGAMVNHDARNISRYENLKISPGLDTTKAIAKALNTTIDYLVGDEDGPQDKIIINGLPITPREANHIVEYRKLDKNTMNYYDGLLESLNKNNKS